MRKPCLQCGRLTEGSYCAAHRPTYSRPYRGSSTAQGYDRQWRKVRLAVLERDGWACYLCGKQLVGADATVDHIVPIAVAPHLRLDEGNLRACCRGHNSARANAARRTT